ncbi:MAG: YybH family protein [Gemmatimonadales bacterium]
MWPRPNLILLAGAFAWGCQAPQPPIDVTAEMRAANGQFTAAFTAHDAQALAGLYTEDAKVLPPNSDFVVGRTAIQTFWQGVMDAGVAGAALTVEEAVGTDSLAVEVGRYRLSSSAGDTIDEGKYIVWWKRASAGWRLHRDIWNSSRPAS